MKKGKLVVRNEIDSKGGHFVTLVITDHADDAVRVVIDGGDFSRLLGKPGDEAAVVIE